MSDLEMHPTGTGEELKRLRAFVDYIKGTLGECECYDYPSGCVCHVCKMRTRINLLWINPRQGGAVSELRKFMIETVVKDNEDLRAQLVAQSAELTKLREQVRKLEAQAGRDARAIEGTYRVQRKLREMLKVAVAVIKKLSFRYPNDSTAVEGLERIAALDPNKDKSNVDSQKEL